MDATAALIAGLAAGLAIAMQIGAVSLLLVETSVSRGMRIGVASGLGVATVDLLFAAAAAVAGGTAGAVLSEHEGEIRVVAATTLAGIALYGLVAIWAERAKAAPPAARDARARAVAVGGGPGAHYLRFFAITSVNPLTIASFAAVATSLPAGDAAAAVAFAAGAGAASAGWHLLLTAAAGHAGRWITPGIQRGLAIGGRAAVLLIAAHLALGA
jgi:threonine/homoserine/homoserine lactone efflux protein